MEVNLDAITAAANRAEQVCDFGLGNCSRVLHIGFFFDGVGRNVEQDATTNRLSNIARLYRAYPTPDKDSPSETYQKHYISGLGTPFDETTAERLQGMMDKSLGSIMDDIKNTPTDMAKEAFKLSVGGASSKEVLTEMKDTLLTPKGRQGLLSKSAINAMKRVSIEATPWLRDSEYMAYTFLTGADTRLNSTKMFFKESFDEAVKNGEVPVRLISVSVFGFDMGGTLGRQFLDNLLDDVCDKKASGSPTFRGVPVDIVFTGLFDCSRDTPQSSDNGLDYAASAVSWLPGPVAKTLAITGTMFGRKYLEHMSPLPDTAKASLHLVAAHERRLWRCVYRTGRGGSKHQEVLMPGCSEDIGGGLQPDEQKPSAELCRVSLRKMYVEAVKVGIPFPDLKTLDEFDPVVAAYFTLQDGVQNRSAGQWVSRYQQAVPDKLLSYGAMNRHLDSYFEWLGKQHYEYKSELQRLESIQSGIFTAAGASMGLVGITPQAKQAAREVIDEILILKKHWGWLADVVNAANLLLTRQLSNPPQLFLVNIYMPACARAKRFIECGAAGFNGEPLPMMLYNAPEVLYAWFLHDVQRGEGINDAYFYIRWTEPRK